MTADGTVRARADAARSVGYGDLVAGRRFELPLDPAAKRKPAEDWTVLGTSVPRVDLPALAAGTFEFVHNVRVKGMVHGAVVRPPGTGATLERVDEGSVRGMPGFITLVVRKNFVGVVCEKPWQAVQAARALKASWKTGPALPSQEDFYTFMRRQPSRDSLVVDSRDVDRVFEGAATVIRATYQHPYQMHGAMGTSCAVADVGKDAATIWSATQSAYPTRDTAAMLLGLPPEQRARRLRARVGVLWPERRRHGVLRRGAAFTGGRPAGAGAALPAGRDGVGELRLCLRHRPARRAR